MLDIETLFPNPEPAGPAPAVPQSVAAFLDAVRAVRREPRVRELLRGDVVGLVDPGTPQAVSDRRLLEEAMAPLVRAVEDEEVRFVLLLDCLKGPSDDRSSFAPWDQPRERQTKQMVAPAQAGSEHYRGWLHATLADVAMHFARAVGRDADQEATRATLAVARMIRAAALALCRSDADELTGLAEKSRAYLQRRRSWRDHIWLAVPDRAPTASTCATSSNPGTPPGSVVYIEGGDVTAPNRTPPASMLRDELARRIRDGFTDPERADIIAGVPHALPVEARPISDEEIVRGTWDYLRSPGFRPITEHLPAPLPWAPDDALVAELTEAVTAARNLARERRLDGKEDPEDAAEYILRAFLRHLGYPETKAKSLFDVERKAPPAADT